MREIKFRAWYEEEKEMQNVIDIYFNKNKGDIESFVTKGKKATYHTDVHTHKLMQYTGLKDTNGVEIYEGDIVKVISGYGWEQISDVVWGLTSKHYGNYPAFSMPEIETELNSFAEVFDSGDYEIEVIGNIYENPELLETKKSS